MNLRSFYRFTARCYLLTLGLMVAICIETSITGKTGDLPFAIVFPMGTLGALCAVLFIPFWLGMIWDCIFRARISILAKALWLIFIVPTVYLGMLVYYFVVFERVDSPEGDAAVPRWKKLECSLVSVILGAVALAGLLLLLPGKSENPIEVLFLATVLIFAVGLTGWLIAVPLILVVNNVSGWRFWFYLGIGSSIGPVLAYQGMLSPFLRSYKGQYSQTPTTLAVLGISAVLSSIATLSYLVLLRRAQMSVAHSTNLTTAIQ